MKNAYSATYGCIRFFDSYRFISSSLDSLGKTLVDKSHKNLKTFKDEIVDNDGKLNIIKEIKTINKEDRYNIDSFKVLIKHYPIEIIKLEEALNENIGENDLKILKTDFPDKWKYLTNQLAYAYEYFNSIDDSQKLVDNLRKEDFFSKLKNDYPGDEEIKLTKELIKLINIKN